MSPTLALIGGAEWTEVNDPVDRALIDRGGTDVLVLPAAAAYENPARMLERAEAHLSRLGASMDVLPVWRRADAADPAVASRVATARFIYLTGGSPMHLRSVLKDTPLLDAMLEAHLAGGALVAAAGEAASVLSGHMVDPRGGAYTVGLDLITTLTVVPRLGAWSEDKLHRTVGLAPQGLVVAGIPEGTALIHDESGWSTLGEQPVSVFASGHRADFDALPSSLIG